jgi:hypothetical protein
MKARRPGHLKPEFLTVAFHGPSRSLQFLLKVTQDRWGCQGPGGMAQRRRSAAAAFLKRELWERDKYDYYTNR